MTGDTLSARLTRGIAGAGAVKMAGLAIGFVVQVVLARSLGAESYGVYAYVLTWMTLLAFLGLLGFGQALLRFASAYVAGEQWGLLRGVIRYAERRVLAASVLIALVGAGVNWALAERLPPDLNNTFYLGFLLLPLLTMSELRTSIAQAFGRTATAFAPTSLLPRLTVLIVICAASGLSLDFGAPSAMAALTLGTCLGFAVLTLTLRRARPRQVERSAPEEHRHEWRSAATPLLLLSGTQVLFSQTDILMLGWLAGPSAAGLYVAAVRLSDFAAYPALVITLLAGPMISALYWRGDYAGLQSLVTTSTSRALGLSLIIIVPLVLFAEHALHLFGDEFPASASALRILLAAQLLVAAAGLVGLVMRMTGHERAALVMYAGAAALAIGLNAILIPIAGLEGAATVRVLSTAVWVVGGVVYVWRRLRIVPSALLLPARRLVGS